MTVILLVFVLGIVALAVDVGYLQVAKVQLQQSADAAALAAVSELVDNEALSTTPDLTDEIASARNLAVEYAGANKVGQSKPLVDPNVSNDPSGEVVIGYLPNPSNPSATMDLSQRQRFNAVRVTVQRTASRNGEVGMHFPRIFGIESEPVQATATAAVVREVKGFQAPSDGSNLPILPFALDAETWDDMLAGGGEDQWSWDPVNQLLGKSQDGLREVNLYPQGTGAPGQSRHGGHWRQ